jgi:hypothetical protein
VTATELQASIAKLETALARGEMRVQFADRLVEYKSTSAILDAIAYLRSQVLALSGRGRQSFGVAVKGF